MKNDKRMTKTIEIKFIHVYTIIIYLRQKFFKNGNKLFLLSGIYLLLLNAYSEMKSRNFVWWGMTNLSRFIWNRFRRNSSLLLGFNILIQSFVEKKELRYFFRNICLCLKTTISTLDTRKSLKSETKFFKEKLKMRKIELLLLLVIFQEKQTEDKKEEEY